MVECRCGSAYVISRLVSHGEIHSACGISSIAKTLTKKAASSRPRPRAHKAQATKSAGPYHLCSIDPTQRCPIASRTAPNPHVPPFTVPTRSHNRTNQCSISNSRLHCLQCSAPSHVSRRPNSSSVMANMRRTLRCIVLRDPEERQRSSWNVQCLNSAESLQWSS